jgi:predicted Zn-dependent protease with MMP-like domain
VGSARRLLFFYSFLFKRSPIVVIRVPERETGQNYADVTAAVRDLADLYGLRVIVDGSPNSIPPELLATKRETVISVEPMSKEQIESIPEFKDLIDFLKSHNLDEPVWKVLGGSPADYLKLEEAVIDSKLSLSDTAVVNQVKNHLQSVLSDSLNKILKSSSTTKQIMKIFRGKKIIMISMPELEAEGLLLDYPNKVFREVKTMGRWFVEPSSPAVSLIISENIQNDEGVDELLDRLFK